MIARDKINDEKKAVSTLLKSKSNTDDIDRKLRQYLLQRANTAKNLTSYDDSLSAYIEEVTMTMEKVGINGYAWDENIATILG